MKLLKVLLIVTLLLAAGWAAPNRILQVERRPGTVAALALTGVRSYGMTDHYLLLEPGDAAQQQLSAAGLDYRPLEIPSRGLYLVFLRNADIERRVLPLVSPLLTDGRQILVALDESAALDIARLGGELFRLPDEPALLPQLNPVAYPAVAFADSFVQRLVTQVSADTIRKHIRRLQDFKTRYSPTDSCRAAEQYIFDYFTRLGLDSVAFDSYPVPRSNDTWRNVIGTRRGRVNPQRVVIVCGHMDATSQVPDTFAPGAEDNASGTAMALEAARIFARENLDNTVKFIAFTGEEQGLFGSFDYARRMRGQNADIIAALNFDMIAYPGGRWGVEIYCDEYSHPLADFEDAIAGQYTTFNHHVTQGSYGSDQLAFQYAGYPATAGAEFGNTDPYYHTTGDTLGHISMELAAEVARMALATAATLAVVPGAPSGFELWDAGTGGALLAEWASGPEPDLAGYWLYWSMDSLVFTDSLQLGLVTSHTITGLQDGTRYYATIKAFDAGGRAGPASPRRSAIPGATPRTPAGLFALPMLQGMQLAWNRNLERDLTGYHVLRSTTPGIGYQRLNSAPLAETTYQDLSLLSDTMYYYAVTAVDRDSNESGRSNEARGKPISLDHGILLVDETRNGNGTRGSPSDAQIDDFYHNMLHGFNYLDWDVTQQGTPTAGDVGPYSTIVWHGDDLQEQRIVASVPGLANHLRWGGRLWLVGWKPVNGLLSGAGAYGRSFQPGEFVYDALHLSEARISNSMSFTGAAGRLGYPSAAVDSMKALASLHGRLISIEADIPRDAETVLTYVAAGDTSFQGMPVGVRWLTDPGRAVLFGFPFYYLRDEEARPLAIRVLQDLGEPYAVEESPRRAVSASFSLAPNPFSRATTVRYSLPRPGRVTLSVYNPAGRAVRQLVHREQASAAYQVEWNGRDTGGRQLPAGVYIIRLESAGTVFSRTVLLR